MEREKTQTRNWKIIIRIIIWISGRDHIWFQWSEMKNYFACLRALGLGFLSLWRKKILTWYNLPRLMELSRTSVSSLCEISGWDYLSGSHCVWLLAPNTSGLEVLFFSYKRPGLDNPGKSHSPTDDQAHKLSRWPSFSCLQDVTSKWCLSGSVG